MQSDARLAAAGTLSDDHRDDRLRSAGAAGARLGHAAAAFPRERLRSAVAGQDLSLPRAERPGRPARKPSLAGTTATPRDAGRPDPLGALPHARPADQPVGQHAADLGERVRPCPRRRRTGPLDGKRQGLRMDRRRQEREPGRRSCWSVGRRRANRSSWAWASTSRTCRWWPPSVSSTSIRRRRCRCRRTSLPRPRRTTRCRVMRCATTWTCSTRSVRPPKERGEAIAAYYACISFMDEKLGRGARRAGAARTCATTP